MQSTEHPIVKNEFSSAENPQLAGGLVGDLADRGGVGMCHIRLGGIVTFAGPGGAPVTGADFTWAPLRLIGRCSAPGLDHLV